MILYPFLAVDRYEGIFEFLSEMIPTLRDLTEEVQSVRKLMGDSKVNDIIIIYFYLNFLFFLFLFFFFRTKLLNQLNL